MTKKEAREIIRRETMSDLEGTIDEAIFQKALAKAKRWMVKAYGSVDLQEWINEGGGSIASYYQETIQRPSGRDTFNRDIDRQNRG